jgi:hypothetical protein
MMHLRFACPWSYVGISFSTAKEESYNLRFPDRSMSIWLLS